MWLCLRELWQLNYLNDPIRHLLTDIILLILPSAYHRAQMYIPFTVMIISVSLNTFFCNNSALLVVCKVI